MPYRDGFDDDELVLVSPSKAKDKPKAETTPRAGNKRKRNTNPSPVQPLVLEPVTSTPTLSVVRVEDEPFIQDTSRDYIVFEESRFRVCLHEISLPTMLANKSRLCN